MKLIASLALCLAFLLSGCLNHFDESRAHQLSIRNVDVSAPLATSGSVELAINATMENTMGPSEPARLIVKAFDLGTSLLTATNETRFGGVAKDRTFFVEVRVKVPRAPGYRLEILLEEDGRLAQQATVSVSNVGAIPRTILDSGVRVSGIDFLVRNVSANHVLIQAKALLTNEGASASRPLRVEVKAREVSTSLVADESSAPVDSIRPEATRAVNASLDVPGGYNYQVEAVLWDEDYVVGRHIGNVQLLPTFTKPKDEEIVVERPQISDFVQGTGAPPQSGEYRDYGPGDYSQAPESKTPGFEAAALVAGLALAILVTYRRRT